METDLDSLTGGGKPSLSAPSPAPLPPPLPKPLNASIPDNSQVMEELLPVRTQEQNKVRNNTRWASGLGF